jgi:hypothetical protein
MELAVMPGPRKPSWLAVPTNHRPFGESPMETLHSHKIFHHGNIHSHISGQISSHIFLPHL